jgi:N-dimethylarginine dimethylaminohydrolase
MNFPLPPPPAFKAEVTDTASRYAVRHETYISAKSEADAIRKLRREGFEVHSVKPVLLTHLGGEVSA